MAIIKGETASADLLKVTLEQNIPYEEEKDEHHDSKKRGAYSLLKENKIYALSNLAFGFVTLTDANLDTYWYYPTKWLKNRMNRYFMDRYLRKDPIKYEFRYKNKCFGCSKCLDEKKLRKDLEVLINDKEIDPISQQEKRVSMVQKLFRKFANMSAIKSKEALKQIQEQKLKKNNKLKP